MKNNKNLNNNLMTKEEIKNYIEKCEEQAFNYECGWAWDNSDYLERIKPQTKQQLNIALNVWNYCSAYSVLDYEEKIFCKLKLKSEGKKATCKNIRRQYDNLKDVDFEIIKVATDNYCTDADIKDFFNSYFDNELNIVEDLDAFVWDCLQEQYGAIMDDLQHIIDFEKATNYILQDVVYEYIEGIGYILLN